MLLERLLGRSGFTNVVSTTDSGSAVVLCAEHDPDIVLLDLQMPAPDGFEVMRQLEPLVNGPVRLPVVVLTADESAETRRRALARGASDFLSKPLDTTEVVLRIRNLLLTRVLQRELQRRNESLEQRVRDRTRELEEARVEIIERLALAAEYRDDATHEHTRRVGRVSALIARQLGHDDDYVELIRRAAPLHDLGKLGVSDAILLKPGPLTPPEYEAMMAHVGIGTKILRGSRSKVLQLGEEIVRTHHERWDGTGYLSGTQGEDIPLSGRIVAVADVFDALVHERPYKHAWPAERALEEIVRLSGRHFDPRIVDAFVALGLETLTARFSQRLAA